MEMKTDMVSRLATMLMQNNPGMSMEQALDEIFSSETYEKLMNDRTQLYYQSARYVYSFLEEEMCFKSGQPDLVKLP